ncbi:MAG TPA: hypothetical protein PKX78_02480 [Candidatus Woesebacteria bacterium]|nr:hypothetical protein [Candidatus Woesebacteria bacterium]
MPTTEVKPTTQAFLDIFDITNNLIITKSGFATVVLSVDAMNFGLLAEEEQDGVIYAYAGLLNSLNYPIQIVIQSKTKDVTNYLRLLQEQEAQAPNKQIQQRIRQYTHFVSNLIRERNVLDKQFYVAISASPTELGILVAKNFIPGQGEVKIEEVDKNQLIEKATQILEPKRDHLVSQFARIGLYSRQLSTQEMIKLFYVNYNPEAAEGQEIADSKEYKSSLVGSG